MPRKELDNLARVGKLKAEPAAEAETAGLIRSGLLRLRDAKMSSLSLESRFDLAYNAAHALSLAALRRHGYRSEAEYEGDVDIDEQLVEALIRVTTVVAERLQHVDAGLP